MSLVRINIEADLFTRLEWSDLIIAFQDRSKALGELCWAWIIAQRYWLDKKNPRQLIPFEVWERERMNEALITCGFAERRSNGIYIRGSEQQFQWWFDGIDQRSKAGKASVEARMKKFGTAVPQKAPNVPNDVRTGVRTESNGAEPSYSSSSSLNLKNDQNPKLDKPTRDDFEQLYKRAYPRKEGKKRGIEICVRTIKTFERMQDLESAVHAYAAHCKKSNQYLKHFGTFMSCWEDYLEPISGPVVLKAVPNETDKFYQEIEFILQVKRQFTLRQEDEGRKALGHLEPVVDLLGGWTDMQMLSDDQASRNKIIRALTEGHVEANHA